MEGFWLGFAALVPSIGVGVLFYFVMRFVLRADKNERAQLAELEREAQQESPNSSDE
jgi:predicted permease